MSGICTCDQLNCPLRLRPFNVNVTPVTFFFHASFPLVRKTNSATGSEGISSEFCSNFHQRVEVLAAGTSAMLRTLALLLFLDVVLHSVFVAVRLPEPAAGIGPGWA